jgi:hypothetical protein
VHAYCQLYKSDQVDYRCSYDLRANDDGIVGVLVTIVTRFLRRQSGLPRCGNAACGGVIDSSHGSGEVILLHLDDYVLQATQIQKVSD